MAASEVVKNILSDMNKTIGELQSRALVRDVRGVSNRLVEGGQCRISFPGRDGSGSILFDKRVSGAKMLDELLKNLQYNVLLYDKSIIQAEFTVDDNHIIKERLVFIKKHNKIWNAQEIERCEERNEDWFSDAGGVPIMLRIDHAPENHIDGEHAATHLTISNHESCRIPIKGIVTFSEFIRLILLHFYDLKLRHKVWRLESEDTITELEKRMVHMSWS